AAMGDYICAFDNRSGEEIWNAALPAGGQATPMSYKWQGKQYVPIVAGVTAALGRHRETMSSVLLCQVNRFFRR
ncbi:MAG: hypothetical protein P8N51_03155, partial [Pseudomonadales bacterium]|nr:hypothetical protein [Pseudomonadales bacterium]